MTNLQYLPPDFEERCTAYRAALDEAYASGCLDDAGRLRLEQERERIKLRAEDARELEDAYLQENALLLLERRLQAQFKALEARIVELESDSVRRLRVIQENMATLEQRFSQTQHLREALDRLQQQINTVKANSSEAIEANLNQLRDEIQETLVASQAEIRDHLEQRLRDVEGRQSELLDNVQRSQTSTASQAEILADLQQRLRGVEGRQSELLDNVQTTAASQAEIIADLQQRLANQTQLRDEVQRSQEALTTSQAQILTDLQQRLQAVEANQAQIPNRLPQRLRAVENNQTQLRDQVQRSQEALTTSQSQILTDLQQRLQAVEANQAHIGSHLPKRLQDIKTNQAALLKKAQNSQALAASQIETLANLLQHFQALNHEKQVSVGQLLYFLQKQLYSLLATSARVVYRRANGKLGHTENYISLQKADVDLRNFMVDARFYNPYEGSAQDVMTFFENILGKASQHQTPKNVGWSYGFGFRHTSNNEQYRLYVESNGKWNLVLVTKQNDKYKFNTITKGKVNNLVLDSNEFNHLRLVVKDNIALFFVNREYIAILDVSGKNVSGNVWIGTGFDGDKIEGESTRYEDFTVWSLP